MKKIFLLTLLLSIVIFSSSSWADLDLEKEVLVIPDTHNVKPYIWNVQRNPHGYELVMDNSQEGPKGKFSFKIKGETSAQIEEMHVFITDEDLHTFVHLQPLKGDDGSYLFDFSAPKTGGYRFEIVFKTNGGWIDLFRDMKLKTSIGKKEPVAKPGDEDYSVKIKLYPKKLYAEHVSTFLYEISYKGKPLKELEKMKGSDMIVAAWDEKMREFVYMTSRQNLGGPDVAVSVVFMRPGKHAVFAEFKHNGVVRTVDSVVNVLAEPRQDISPLLDLKPSD